MEGEASSRWKRFIGDPENDPYFQRYPWAAKDLDGLFDAIGDDLGSPKREIREVGFWALIAAMPEVLDILHERESRRPSLGGENNRVKISGCSTTGYGRLMTLSPTSMACWLRMGVSR